MSKEEKPKDGKPTDNPKEDNSTNNPKDNKDENPKDEGVTELDVKVKVEGMTEILQQLKEERERRKKSEEDLKALMTEKTELEEKSGLTQGELDKYKTQLELIAQKEFEKKRGIILGKAKELVKDEERLGIITEKLKTPEDLQATEFMLETLANALSKGKDAQDKLDKADLEKQKADAEKKVTPAGPAGSVPLTPAQVEGGAGGDEGYESYEAMIRDLRRQEHSDNPKVAAKAKVILNQLFRKWVNSVKNEYDQIRNIAFSQEEHEKKAGKEVGSDEPLRTSIRDITKKGSEAA